MFEAPALFEACTTGDAEAVRRIVAAEPARIHDVGPGIGSTPLIFAAHRGFLDIVAILLDAGANVEARERASNTTAVHWAAEGGHVPVLERLLGAGARLDVGDGWFNLGPLGWATFVRWAERRWVDRPGATRLLRERGAALDSFSALALGELAHVRNDARLGFVERGRTPLHAAARGFPDAVEALLRSGGDPA